MAATSPTVTIAKDYFDVLLRRSQINEPAITFPASFDSVTIPKVSHDQLLDTARRFENLRLNLFKGGVTEETLAILTGDYNQVQEDTAVGDHGGSPFGVKLDNRPTLIPIPEEQPSYLTTAPNGRHGNSSGTNGGYSQRNGIQKSHNDFNGLQHGYDEYAFMPEDPVDGFLENGNGNYTVQPVMQKPQYKRNAQRTLVLANLAEGTTHVDVVENVRGGMLLDIYLRNDRTCTISFLDEADARAFYGYVKRYDLYVRDKRVEIRWSDRQFVLAGHVANKISIGATRNLIIRNASANHTEDSIREHAEHIHNLVLIKVEFRRQNILINCNSVHNAMFLKTCLMSRASYKGSKIEWDEDECAAPLEMPVRIPKKENLHSKKSLPTLNRFQLLNIDGTEDGSEDDHDTSAGTLPSHFTTTTGITA